MVFHGFNHYTKNHRVYSNFANPINSCNLRKEGIFFKNCTINETMPANQTVDFKIHPFIINTYKPIVIN